MRLQRVFIGLPVPSLAAAQLTALLTPNITAQASLVAMENLHITLAYLGKIPEETLAVLGDNLANVSELLPQTIRVNAIAPFPDRQSGVIAAWVEPTTALTSLFSAVQNILAARQLDADYHSIFRPHITLVRHKSAGLADTGEPMACRLDYAANQLGIYEGVSTAQGYRYHCFFSIDRSAGSSSV